MQVNLLNSIAISHKFSVDTKCYEQQQQCCGRSWKVFVVRHQFMALVKLQMIQPQLSRDYFGWESLWVALSMPLRSWYYQFRVSQIIFFKKQKTFYANISLFCFKICRMGRRTCHWHFRHNFLSNWKSRLSNSHFMPRLTKYRQMGSSNQGFWLHEPHLP